jgi:soluble lytic murein transglycosylase
VRNRTRVGPLLFAVLFLCTALPAQDIAASNPSPAKNPPPRAPEGAGAAAEGLQAAARRLLQRRTAENYAAVEALARRHSGQAGALAWLAVGQARSLDNQWPQAADALERAQAGAGEVRDYADYLLARAFAMQGEQARVTAALREFDGRHPASVHLTEARLLYADALLATGKTAEGIAALERARRPGRADVDLALARAYARTGNTPKAVDVYRRVYYEMPLSSEATEAGRELEALNRRSPIPRPTYGQRKMRAERLAAGRRHSDAAREYRALLAQAPAQEQRALRVALASSLQRSRRPSEARQVLAAVAPAADEVNAQRLHLLAEVARSARDAALMLQHIEELRRAAPGSGWLQESLLSAGNMYMLRGDLERAVAFYSETAERFPKGHHAAFAHWRAAWLTYRLQRREEAAQRFERQVKLFPASSEVSAALYWRGRLAEEEGQGGIARAYYEKLAERFRHFYYAGLARERLESLGPGTAAPVPLLALIPPPRLAPHLAHLAPPNGNLRARKSRLLEQAGLFDFAIRELQFATWEDGGAWATGEIARLHRENERHDLALQALKRGVPGYFSVDLDALPREYWEGLFPRAYWDDLQKYAAENGLDPFLVASLIRQESEFRPQAVSAANAIGLMQIMPSTGLNLARELRIRDYSRALLTQPAFNKRLGTYYLRKRLDNFEGQVEYALAAYNAGAHRVTEWLAGGPYGDVQEFVESIPFTETREYVQAVLRNKRLYQQLYGSP